MYVKDKITRVVNMNFESFDVYIGRGSIYGNPFVIGVDGNRKQCIEKYKDYILTNKELYDSILLLEGKTLGCFCKPKPCHGDVICDLLNKKNFSL